MTDPTPQNSRVEAILKEMRESDWYKTAVGADTLQRIRYGDFMKPFKGETIDDWMKRILLSFQDTLLDEMVKRVEEADTLPKIKVMDLNNEEYIKKSVVVAIINSFRKSV